MKENPLAGKRIAMLAHTYYLWDMRVRREAESLAEAKAHIDVICLNEQSEYKNIIKPNHEKVNGVNVHRIPLSKKRRHVAVYFFRYLVLTLIGMYKLICFNKEKKISVVHVHNMPDFLIFSGLLLKLTGTKIILDVHDPMAELYKSNSNNGKNKLFLFLIGVQEKLSYFFAQRFVTVNVSMKENLIRKGVKPDKIFVLNNFPDLKTFPIVKKPLEWPRNKKNFVLLYTGTITDHYNLEIAIKAIAKTNGILPNLKIKIIGEGDKISEINSLAHQLNIQNK